MNTFEKFRGNERVVEVIKSGFLVNLIPSWIWVFFIGGFTIGTAVLLFILPWPIFAKGAIGLSAAVVLTLITRFLIKIYANTLILTNRRLIQNERKGFFHIARTEWHYEQIYRVRFVAKGLMAKLTNAWYVKIEPLGGNNSVIVGPIVHPAKIQNLILELQREYIKHTRTAYSNPLLQENLGDEASNDLSYRELIDFVRKIMEAEKVNERGQGQERILDKGQGNLKQIT